MGFFDWFYWVLKFLGLGKSGKILFLGLDYAGKTALLHMLREGKLFKYRASFKTDMEELNMGSITWTAFDLGGSTEGRRLWRDFFAKVDGIVFIVDAADPLRFAEAKQELDALLQTEELSKVPFAILGNKIDLLQAVPEPSLKQSLGVTETTGKTATASAGVRPLEVFMCSVVKKVGYGEAFRWLGNHLSN